MADMSFLQLIKPARFSGDKDRVNVEDFWDGLELSFPCFEQIANVIKERTG